MQRLVTLYCLLAGACDTATGLLLVSAPATALSLMGVAATPAEPVYLRWIGAFVGSVGVAYLYPLLGTAAGRVARLPTVLEVTALVRLAVALFTGLAIARGMLEPAWASVPATDLVLAVVQIALLQRWRRVEDVF